MKHLTVIACAAVAAAILLSGCYESAEVTWYEAGVYKGERDPLLGRLKNGDLQQQLEDRLHAVQTDR